MVSSYFWEHLNKEQKFKCLKNISRVLKPDGLIIFLYDVSTQNPLVNFFRKRIQRTIKKNFLNMMGILAMRKLKKILPTLKRITFLLSTIKVFKKLYFKTHLFIKVFRNWKFFAELFIKSHPFFINRKIL